MLITKNPTQNGGEMAEICMLTVSHISTSAPPRQDDGPVIHHTARSVGYLIYKVEIESDIVYATIN